MSCNKTKKSLLHWILFYAVGFNFLHYVALAMAKLNDWLFIDPYFINRPSLEYIFLLEYQTVSELLQYKFLHAVFWSFVGILGWVIQQHSLRKRIL